MNRTLARRYASAIYAVAADANAVDRVGDQLTRICDAIEADPSAKQFFLAPVIDRYEKERALGRAFEGRVEPVALHALLLLVRKHRERLLWTILDEYRALAMHAHGVEPLTITTARPLSAQELEGLKDRIEGIYRRRFVPHVIVDPNLIGGLRITMGDRRIDGTIAGRLEQLARSLAATA